MKIGKGISTKSDMKDYSKAFYKSKQWQSMREYVMKRDKRLCQDCLKKGFVISAEEVHHIEQITQENINDADVTLNESNLISLCRECHKARHKKKNKRYFIDKNGKVIPKD